MGACLVASAKLRWGGAPNRGMGVTFSLVSLTSRNSTQVVSLMLCSKEGIRLERKLGVSSLSAFGSVAEP